MKKILIIEDEPDIAEMLKMMVESKGYVADYALDARKGMGLIKSHDLLLLDIIMPNMSGREVLVEMKKKGIKTPTIVVSAVGLPEEVERELKIKYPEVEFVSKTHLREELMSKIKIMLSKKR